MSILSLPAAIHVDPNMHENLYRDLLAFTLVFDRISLYAVFGGRLDKYFPLGIDGFIELVEDPDPRNSAFVLTAPEKFLEKKEREERFADNPELQWTDYETWLVGPKRGIETVIETTGAKKIRESAWRHADQYRKRLHKDIRTNEALAKAYAEAKRLFQTETKSAESDARVLPTTFFHKVTYEGNHYKEYLNGGDVLPLLAFEHYTKPQIIDSIKHKLRSLDPATTKLVMYVPAAWHSLLLEGLSFDKPIGGTGTLIEMTNDRLDEDGSRVFDSVRRMETKETTPAEIIRAVVDFRRRGGPAKFRTLIERTVSYIAGAATPENKQVAINNAVDQLAWLCGQMNQATNVGNTIFGLLTPLLFSAGPLLAYYVPEIRSQVDYWATWSTLLVGATRSRELCLSAAKRIVEPGYNEDEKELASMLLPLFGSAQPHRSISAVQAETQ